MDPVVHFEMPAKDKVRESKSGISTLRVKSVELVCG